EWHKEVHGGKKKAGAEAALAALGDPKAAAAVYREFGLRGAADQLIAVQVLGQIDAPLSSQALAILAVYGVTPQVRRRATESLRARDPADFAGALIDLLADPLKYEVRPVGGPGSPGVLFVEGEKFDVKRFYAPPPAPDVVPRPGDIIAYDDAGMPSL